MNNLMKKALMLGVIAMLPVQALAADAAPKAAPKVDKGARAAEYFAKSDTNSDGKISKEEYSSQIITRANKRFDEIDGNKDGFLTKEETKAYRDANPRPKRGPKQ